MLPRDLYDASIPTPAAASAGTAGADRVAPLFHGLRLELLAQSPEMRPSHAVEARAQLHEAMSPEVTQAQHPTYRADEPFGDWQTRAPQWSTPDRAFDAAPDTTRTRGKLVGLLRLADDPDGVGDECQVELASYKLETVALREAADAADRGLNVVVVDAGSRFDEAVLALASLRDGGARALVCATDMTTDQMSTLVALGAADVVRYPVSVDALAQKLERMIRRRR